MRQVRELARFNRDFKRESKGQHRVFLTREFVGIVQILAKDEPLPDKYRDHALSGDWKDHRDCHIKPDLVLIYFKIGDDVLQLVRLGSHSELGI
jgi:mRNA interferase YafQ